MPSEYLLLEIGQTVAKALDLWIAGVLQPTFGILGGIFWIQTINFIFLVDIHHCVM